MTECRAPELIPVIGSQPAGDVSHKPDGRLPLLSARPTVTPTTLKRANFVAWWTEAQWVWTVCLRLLPDSVAIAIWTWALLRLSPACCPLSYRATHSTQKHSVYRMTAHHVSVTYLMYVLHQIYENKWIYISCNMQQKETFVTKIISTMEVTKHLLNARQNKAS